VNAKQLYEKMVDYRQYGVILLAAGVFFYLGVIIPSEVKVMKDIYISAGASAGFLLFSVLFLSLSRSCRNKLIDSEEGQEYLMKNKRP
jgi:hypothetical protein